MVRLVSIRPAARPVWPGTRRRSARAAAVALSGVLALGLTACGSSDSGNDDSTGGADEPTTGDRASAAAADWLEAQLSDGLIVNEEFGSADYGATVDAVYALAAVGDHDQTVAAMRSAVVANGEAYVTTDGVWAGNAGKLVTLVTDDGGDPADVAGFDALAVLEERVDADGRTSDQSDFGDFANTFGQIWAVKGLTGADSAEADAAAAHLLLQQCEAGFFRQDFSAADAKDQSCDAAEGAASVDATALAVVVLTDVADQHPDLQPALDRAIDYLLSEQAEDGSFIGSDELPANTNSTGLAGWAFQIAGEDEAAAAAAEWVRAHQLPECDGALADEAGAIAYDAAAITAAGADGITEKSSYQWRLAATQAIPVLRATPEDASPAECPSAE